MTERGRPRTGLTEADESRLREYHQLGMPTIAIARLMGMTESRCRRELRRLFKGPK